ncbi:hypothetical protein P3S68_006391 [Capsicum galapagoense]
MLRELIDFAAKPIPMRRWCEREVRLLFGQTNSKTVDPTSRTKLVGIAVARKISNYNCCHCRKGRKSVTAITIGIRRQSSSESVTVVIIGIRRLQFCHRNLNTWEETKSGWGQER